MNENLPRKMRTGTLLALVIIFLLLSGMAGGFFFGGFQVGYHQIFPFTYVKKVDSKLRQYAKAVLSFGKSEQDAQSAVETKNYESIFVRLKGEGKVISPSRPGSGGGLTSFGDMVVLLTHEGKILYGKSAHDMKQSNIDVPYNGFEDYKEIAQSEKYRDYEHIFDWFRYNGITYFSSSIGQGLAVSYTDFDKNRECYTTAVSVLLIDDDIEEIEKVSAQADDWTVIYRTQPCLPLKKQKRAIEAHMAGGRMVFASPDTLYLASGDYHWDGVYAPEVFAQDPTKDYGKVIQIDLAKREGRILAIGFRNMQGIVIDRGGALWVVDHGPRGGDELNHIVAGGNYGWPIEMLGTGYDKLPWPNTISYGRHDAFTEPVFAWLPAVAPSGLTLIDGFHETWDGDLLMSTLRDQSLHRIRVQDGRVLFAERIHIGKRIRYVHQHGDGRIVLWTDNNEIVFLTADEQGFGKEFVDRYFESREYADTEKERIESALDACMECHSLESGDHENAPSLAQIFEAPIAATSYVGYSDALKRRGGEWSRAELRAFLIDPAAYAPGTVMPAPNINDPFVIEAVIDFLEALGDTPE